MNFPDSSASSDFAFSEASWEDVFISPLFYHYFEHAGSSFFHTFVKGPCEVRGHDEKFLRGLLRDDTDYLRKGDPSRSFAEKGDVGAPLDLQV